MYFLNRTSLYGGELLSTSFTRVSSENETGMGYNLHVDGQLSNTKN